eukprot:scaffold305_cov267-Chaetoceros_neogracile.AAC.40
MLHGTTAAAQHSVQVASNVGEIYYLWDRDEKPIPRCLLPQDFKLDDSSIIIHNRIFEIGYLDQNRPGKRSPLACYLLIPGLTDLLTMLGIVA